MKKDKFEKQLSDEIINMEDFLKCIRNNKDKYLNISEEDRKSLIEYLKDINTSIEYIEDIVYG